MGSGVVLVERNAVLGLGWPAAVGVGLGTALSLSCSDAAPSREPDLSCTPRSTLICAGPGGCTGTKRCGADGSGYGVCVCTPADGGTCSVCDEYQVCSDGTDGHQAGACWGCAPSSGATSCPAHAPRGFAYCPNPPPRGCLCEFVPGRPSACCCP
jgi:hypothetical protein